MNKIEEREKLRNKAGERAKTQALSVRMGKNSEKVKNSGIKQQKGQKLRNKVWEREKTRGKK